MLIYRGSWEEDKMEIITKEDLLIENLEYLIDENDGESKEYICKELEKMMQDKHALKFETIEEEKIYDEWCNEINFIECFTVFNKL